jgi:putative colanic acid biosynthesis acetyltransferase WcaF
LFGARIGKGVVIKPQVKIHFPWKLTVGDFTWIGEEVFILNFEPITIGAHCCLSQRAFLCGGDHDYRQPNMPYRNGPIVVEDGAWIGAQVFVARDVTIGAEAVITAGSVVTQPQPPRMICGGYPCIPLKTRWLSGGETAKSGPVSNPRVHSLACAPPQSLPSTEADSACENSTKGKVTGS